MTDGDALLWRIGRVDSRYLAVIAVVVCLETSPGVERLLRRVDLVSRMYPRLRQRVDDGTLEATAMSKSAGPRWESDPEFDLRRHVVSRPAPGEGGLDEVLALAASSSAEGFEPSHPPWHMELVEGMAGGRAAMVLRLHHSITDGRGALELAGVLFDLDPADGGDAIAEPGGHAGVGGGEGEAPDGGDRLADDLRHEAGVVSDLLRWARPALSGLARDAIADPERRASETLGMARSVLRLVTPSTAPASRLMSGRSDVSVFSTCTLDLAEARAVARSAGATVNDVYVSAALEGLRRYHELHDSAPESLRVGIPFDLRPAGDLTLGNRFFPARLLIPLQVVDPMDRLRMVHRMVIDERSQPAVRVQEAMAAVAARTPGADRTVAKVLSSVDVMVSNLVGSRDTLYLAGARVLRVIPFGPRTGSALNLTTVSYEGTLHIGINVDPAATPDTSTLVECLSDAFAGAVIYA